MRRVLFWMHLSAGALISLLVIFFSVTGALLAYERPIVRAADEHSYRIDPSRQQIRLPLDALMALVTAALPAPVEMVTTHQDPHPQPPGRGNGAALRRRAPGKYSLPAHLDQAFAQATSGVEDWQSTSLRSPPGKEGLSFLVDRGDGGHPEKHEQVLIDPNTLEELHREPFASLNRGQRWRAWVRFIHTGEAGGWWGETLAALTACVAVLLSFTGLVLFFNRLLRWRRRTTHHKANTIEISA
ncbi:MAG: hypothetical protein QOK38_1969 [Acidobacteriaceae bacterium]|nr:hypothetical protein [Acidobacteriaceae bacterium]